MKNASDNPEELRNKILGLGDSSIHKSHYASLRQRLVELERFRSLVDLSSDLLFVVENPSGRILDVSASACMRLSTARAALLSASFADLVPGATWEQMMVLFAELSSGPERSAIVNAELSFGPAGHALPVEIAVQVVRSGDNASSILAARDITERRNAEQQLRLAAAAMNAAANSILLTDREGTILSVNPAFTKLTGYTAEEVRGATPSLLAVGLNSDHLYQDLCESILSGSVWHGELLNRRKDGSLYVQETTIAPVRASEDGEISHFVGILSDITDRKRAEEALLRSEKLASVGRMAAAIAHEINNPLSAAMNAIYLATLDPALSAFTRETLETAEQELHRVAHMTKQTLGFYKESGRPAAVQLPELLDSVLDLYEPKARNKSIQVRRRYGCTIAVQAVESELRQVISNLVANSIDALPQAGTLHARVAGPFTGPGHPPRVRLTIADNGTGISPENRKRIFEPFFTTKQDLGTGLGLWISGELVKKNDGRIQLRSKVGRGSVFMVWLPTERRTQPLNRIA
jgi:PAS domain S-box-containing protein